MRRVFSWLVLVVLAGASPAWGQENISKVVRENYTRKTYKIRMRDGVHLHTIVYSPKGASQKHPILLMRTPYSIGPYEEDKYRFSLGPNKHFVKEGYIFAYQDVRGRYMSEGVFDHVRPQKTKYESPTDIDESTDTYDSIEFLVKNVPNNNGKVGQYGISYPGFYTSAGMINAHPALQASSPQAPIADWFFDDFIHHGAFFLSHAFGFLSSFGQPHHNPTTERAAPFQFPTPDGYKFFLDVGPLKNADKHLKGKIAYWDVLAQHPNYDEYWKSRNIRPHLKKVAPAVMVVGGHFDAEDLFGAYQTYYAVEKQNPGIFNVLVMGPWAHGAWASPDATRLGHIDFGSNTSAFYQEKIELAFFNYFLKGKGENNLPEAYVFETGKNRWREFDHWPPRETAAKSFYLGAKGKISASKPQDANASDSYVSDPNRPVPYIDYLRERMSNEYMTDDQRFASRRPDVLVYQTEPLQEELTIAGPIRAELHVATTGTDADWIVKVIDVFPDSQKRTAKGGKELGGYEFHVRSEVLRGRFRNSYERPQAFTPNEPTKVVVELQDVLHTFQKGHRMQIQIHSTWFPLVDRNPQKFVRNIHEAEESDFIAATHRVFRERDRASAIHLGVLPAKK